MQITGKIDIDLIELPSVIAENATREEIIQFLKSLIIQTNDYKLITELADWKVWSEKLS